MQYNEFIKIKLKAKFLCDLPKRSKLEYKHYTFTKSLSLLLEDLKLINKIDINNKKLKRFKILFEKYKLDKIGNEELDIIDKMLDKAQHKIAKLELVKIDKNKLIILDDTIIFELMQIKIFHDNILLGQKIISLLKAYKIISVISQEVKIQKRKNNNRNHTHFLKGDLFYYDHVKLLRDRFEEQILNEVDTTKREALFYIYFELYTVKKYKQDILEYLKRENLRQLNDNLITLIYIEKDKIFIEFFEPLLNSLLGKVFFTSTSSSLFDYPQHLAINKGQINEYIRDNYAIILDKLKSIGIKSITTRINKAKEIIKNNIAMQLQLNTSSFYVTVLKQDIYPKISYSELLTIYPEVADEKLIRIENKNILNQQRAPNNSIITDKNIEDYFNNKLIIGDEEEMDIVEYFEKDLSDYNKLKRFKSFIHNNDKFEKDNKQKYKKYLQSFLQFLYGTTLGDIIYKVESNVKQLNIISRQQLIDYMISFLRKRNQNKQVEFETNNNISLFYALFIEVAKNNNELQSDITDPVESILMDQCKTFNAKEKNSFKPSIHELIIQMANHLETIIDDSMYSVYPGNNLQSSTVYNKMNILFNYCFYFIVKKGEISKILSADIKEAITAISDNQDTYTKYKSIINEFLEKFDLEIDGDVDRIKYANKSLIMNTEMERLINSYYKNGKHIKNSDLQDAAYYILAFHSGLREIELITRLRKDVFIVDNTIFIDVNTKGLKDSNKNDGNFKSAAGKRRVKFVIENEIYLKIIVRYYGIICEDNTKFLFPLMNEKNKTFYQHKLQKASFLVRLNNYLKNELNQNEFGIKRYVSLHSFRHTYATNNLKNILFQTPENQSKGDFMDFLIKIGHAEPDVTFTYYIHLDFVIYKLL